MNFVYFLLLGLSTLSPSVVRAVFGYEVKDPGVLFVLSAAFFGYAVVLWGINSNLEKHGDLASAVVLNLAIFIVFLLLGWARNLFTFRNVFIPLIIDIALVVWIWSARPKS